MDFNHEVTLQNRTLLLKIVKKDRKWEEDKARKKIIELLEAFGEDDPLTSLTRLKLSSILFA